VNGPQRIIAGGSTDLPAYVSDGLIGLRVRDNPLVAGMALLGGFSASTPRAASRPPPWPLSVAGDIRVNGVWMSQAPQSVQLASFGTWPSIGDPHQTHIGPTAVSIHCAAIGPLRPSSSWA